MPLKAKTCLMRHWHSLYFSVMNRKNVYSVETLTCYTLNDILLLTMILWWILLPGLFKENKISIQVFYLWFTVYMWRDWIWIQTLWTQSFHSWYILFIIFSPSLFDEQRTSWGKLTHTWGLILKWMTPIQGFQ